MSASAATGLAITNPLIKYRALVATKAIKPDPVCPFYNEQDRKTTNNKRLSQQAQHRLAIHLSKLYDRLKDYEPELEVCCHFSCRLMPPPALAPPVGVGFRVGLPVCIVRARVWGHGLESQPASQPAR